MSENALELLEASRSNLLRAEAERDEWRRLHEEKADQLRRALNESSVSRARLVEIALLVNNEWDSSASVEQLAAEIREGIDRRRQADGEEIGALKERLRRALGALEERGVEAAGPDGEPCRLCDGHGDARKGPDDAESDRST